MALKDPDFLQILLERGIDLPGRRVFLHAPMDTDPDYPHDNAVAWVVRALLLLDQKPGPIELWINTPGGYVSEMFGLYDVLTSLQSEVTTIGFGEVASAGCLILAAGDVRMATENCFFMSHEDSPGTLPDGFLAARQRMEQVGRTEKRWAALMGRHTLKKEAYWARIHAGKTRELWLDADQMVEYGIVDKIRRSALQE